jgi:hypothetical protein
MQENNIKYRVKSQENKHKNRKKNIVYGGGRLLSPPLDTFAGNSAASLNNPHANPEEYTINRRKRKAFKEKNRKIFRFDLP